jgi:hypothetical protein
MCACGSPQRAGPRLAACPPGCSQGAGHHAVGGRSGERPGAAPLRVTRYCLSAGRKPSAFLGSPASLRRRTPFERRRRETEPPSAATPPAQAATGARRAAGLPTARPVPGLTRLGRAWGVLGAVQAPRREAASRRAPSWAGTGAGGAPGPGGACADQVVPGRHKLLRREHLRAQLAVRPAARPCCRAGSGQCRQARRARTPFSLNADSVRSGITLSTAPLNTVWMACRTSDSACCVLIGHSEGRLSCDRV